MKMRVIVRALISTGAFFNDDYDGFVIMMTMTMTTVMILMMMNDDDDNGDDNNDDDNSDNDIAQELPSGLGRR